MASLGTHAWVGGSKKEYTFSIFKKETKFNELEGNYIFAKKNDGGTWEAIYIGEGDLSDRPFAKDHLDCAEKKGFTHYHVHINEEEKKRKEEETDLIAGNPECLKENGGCNKTETGK